MRFSTNCRQHALVLLELANEAPELKDRAVALAQMWLSLALLEDQLTFGMDERERRSSTH